MKQKSGVPKWLAILVYGSAALVSLYQIAEESYFLALFILVVTILTPFYLKMTSQNQCHEWRQIGLKMGFEFFQSSENLLSKFSDMTIFSQGINGVAFVGLKGKKKGIEILITDYSYETLGFNNLHLQTICTVTSENLDLPQCFLRKESKIYDFLGKLCDGQDINFDEDKDFSKAFVLQEGRKIERSVNLLREQETEEILAEQKMDEERRRKNEEGIKKLFNPKVRELFLSHSDDDIQFEANGNTIVFHRGRELEPHEFKMLLTDVFAIYKLLKKKTDKSATEV